MDLARLADLDRFSDLLLLLVPFAIWRTSASIVRQGLLISSLGFAASGAGRVEGRLFGLSRYWTIWKFQLLVPVTLSASTASILMVCVPKPRLVVGVKVSTSVARS